MSRSRCVPCGTAGMRGTGFGAIVMQPLRGSTGFGDGETADMVRGAGVGGGLGLLAGAALVYGGVSGIAAKSWNAAGNGALLGSGLAGVLAGGTLAAGRNDLGVPLTLVGAGLLAWGGYRSWRS